MNKTKQTLTPREKEVLDAVRKHRKVKIPSVRELARILAVHSPATVHQHLVALRAKGWL